MKAAVLEQTGNIEELNQNLTIEEVPLPEISSDEVLIKLKYASLNHRDLWIARGMYSKIKLPAILGSDCSGIIHSKGSNVTLQTGEEVIINPSFKWGYEEHFQSSDFNILGMPENGTLAEFVSVNQSNVYKKPQHLDMVQSAAIPLCGVTAYRALFVKGHISKNDNILITGIGGGVSTFALLFALHIGANVFVTSGSDDKINRAISLGARGGINYKQEDWNKGITELSGNKINVIIDGAGGNEFSKYLEICNPGGTIISYGATLGISRNFNLHRLFWKQIKIYGTTAGSQMDFIQMLEFINSYKFVPATDRIFKLDDIGSAFKRMNHSEQFGKIMIEI